MPTKFINRRSDAAGSWTGTHTGIGVDSDDDRLYINVDGTKRPIDSGFGGDLTATTTLTAKTSGATYFLNSATEFVTTLPAVAAGLKFTFVVKAAPSGASYTVVTASSANVMLGQVVSSAGATGDSETSGGDTLSFVDGQAVVGDRADFVCDGTSWYVSAKSKVVAGITITTAS
jgi:hypothetical protein